MQSCSTVHSRSPRAQESKDAVLLNAARGSSMLTGSLARQVVDQQLGVLLGSKALI